MNKAYEYGHITCSMYNGQIDADKKEMKLNRNLLMTGRARQLTYSTVERSEQTYDRTISIQELVNHRNFHLQRSEEL